MSCRSTYVSQHNLESVKCTVGSLGSVPVERECDSSAGNVGVVVEDKGNGGPYTRLKSDERGFNWVKNVSFVLKCARQTKGILKV